MDEGNRFFFSRVIELTEARKKFVTVTLVDGRGSVPQETGAKMLVDPDGLVSGTVGGGKIENQALQYAQKMLLENSELPSRGMVTWNLQRDIGMTCGGEVSLFFESYFNKTWNIAVFGAGHVAQALVRTLLTLDCNIYCIDSRAKWIEKLPKHVSLKAICREDMASEVATLPENCSIVSMTQGHSTDVPVLKEVFSVDKFAFVGVIGSAVKAARIRKELLELNVPSEKLDRLRCPVGLDIGNNTPAEIAISIAAQLLSVREG